MGTLADSRESRRAPKNHQPRQETLRGLIAGAITFLVYNSATLLSLSLFVDAATLVWMVGLFGAAFDLGAWPLVSDFLSGISFIFEDTLLEELSGSCNLAAKSI